MTSKVNGTMFLLTFLLVQLAILVAVEAGCQQPSCPAGQCNFQYKRLVLPDGCKVIFCNSEASPASCPQPTCPARCAAVKSRQKGVVLGNGCCKCVCTGSGVTPPGKCLPPICPDCQFGITIIKNRGCDRCVCKSKPKPVCPAVTCPSNCGAVGTERFTNKKGCSECRCRPCPADKCPLGCRYGTERIKEDGCTKCVCKCGPPICPAPCPALGYCAPRCSVTRDAKNCKVCKCPQVKTCSKTCPDGFKVANGKQLCACCPAFDDDCRGHCGYVEKEGCTVCDCGGRPKHGGRPKPGGRKRGKHGRRPKKGGHKKGGRGRRGHHG